MLFKVERRLFRLRSVSFTKGVSVSFAETVTYCYLTKRMYLMPTNQILSKPKFDQRSFQKPSSARIWVLCQSRVLKHVKYNCVPYTFPFFFFLWIFLIPSLVSWVMQHLGFKPYYGIWHSYSLIIIYASKISFRWYHSHVVQIKENIAKRDPPATKARKQTEISSYNRIFLHQLLILAIKEFDSFSMIL